MNNLKNKLSLAMSIREWYLALIEAGFDDNKATNIAMQIVIAATLMPTSAQS